MVKRQQEVATPTLSTTGTTGSHADKKKKPSPARTEGSKEPAELALACKPLKVGILEDSKRVDRLRKNLKKMGCDGVLDVAWHHKEPAWLQEIWKKDRSAFPNTIRADPTAWREHLMGEVFGLERDGVALPYKVRGHNYAEEYFVKEANPKEG
jgi:hypothetical protein